MSYEFIWKYFLVLGVLAVAGVLGVALFSPHTVQQYYVGHPSQVSTPGYCVMASINWDSDNTVFCTDDITKATDEATKLNLSLHLHP